MIPTKIADWIPGDVRLATPEEIQAREDEDRRMGIIRRDEEFERTIPAKFRWAHLRSDELAKRVPAESIRRAVAGMADESLVLFGPPGAGKTSLGVALLRAWQRRHGGMVRYVDARELGTARIQHRAGDGDPAVVESAIRADLILLDDVGAETASSTNALPDVVCARHNACRRTWITTGLTSKQLSERYDGGVVRRLVDMTLVVRLPGRKVTR